MKFNRGQQLKIKPIFVVKPGVESLTFEGQIHLQKNIACLISILTTKLPKIIQRNGLSECFQSIRHFATSKKNKELIYAAIYKKNISSRQEHKQIKRHLKPDDIQLQAFKKQAQQDFVINDDASTIHMDQSVKYSFGKQSRLDLEHFLSIDLTKLRQQNTNKIRQNTINMSEYQQQCVKRTKTDKSLEDNNLLGASPYFKNTNIDNFNFEDADKNDYDQTVRISRKKNRSQEKKSQQIYIVRQPSRKPQHLGNPYRSQLKAKSLKIKYIKIPIESQIVKITNFKGQKINNQRRSNSLQTVKSEKQCADKCSYDSSSKDYSCSYCARINKSIQMLTRFKLQHY